jgi:hypothetical protein
MPAPPDTISAATSQHRNRPLWPSHYPSSLTTSPRVSLPRRLFTCIATHLAGIRAVAAAPPRSRRRRSPELSPVTPTPPINPWWGQSQAHAICCSPPAPPRWRWPSPAAKGHGCKFPRGHGCKFPRAYVWTRDLYVMFFNLVFLQLDPAH